MAGHASRPTASSSRSSPIASPTATTTPTSGCASCRRGRDGARRALVRVTRAAGVESSSGLGARQRARRVSRRRAAGRAASGSPPCRRSTMPTAAARARRGRAPVAARGVRLAAVAAASAPPTTARCSPRVTAACRPGRPTARRCSIATFADVERRLQRQSRIATTTTRRWRSRAADRLRAVARRSRRARSTRRATPLDAAGAGRRALDVGVRSGLADAEVAVLRDRRRRRRRGTRCATKYRPQMAQVEGSRRRRRRHRSR